MTEKRIEINNPIIALNVFYAKKMNIYPSYISKCNLNYGNQIILLMIPNGERQHDLAIKELSALFIFFFFFFSIKVFFHEHSQITGLQRKGEGISLTPHYHFHLLHRHLDINRAITAENSPLHIGSSQTRNGNLWFPSASRYGLRSIARYLRYMLL